MSEYFTLESSPGHVSCDFTDGFHEKLEELQVSAETEGVKKSLPFGPEVEILRGVVNELRQELPPIMAQAGWPQSFWVGEKLDDFILTLLKGPARDARGRGTNASAKAAVNVGA